MRPPLSSKGVERNIVNHFFICKSIIEIIAYSSLDDSQYPLA